MSYFLAPQALASGQALTLQGEEAAHLLRSRRIRAGDIVALQGPDGRRFSAEVAQAHRRGVVLRILGPLPVPAPPRVRLTLLLAAVKDRALEVILQKTTELGVAEIVIFPSEHATVAHRELASPKVLARWERIVREACKQCDRQFPPRLTIVPGLAQALTLAGPGGLRMLLDPRAEAEAARLIACAGLCDTAALLVGPEGGLTDREVERAGQAGFQAARLGALILRADTAALAAAALILLGCPRSDG
jgi:16S rRNA (uracil1498-N3)-methyltransferase